MLIAVPELRLHPVNFDQRFAAGEFTVQHPGVERAGAVHFQGQARLAGDGMRIQGHLRGEVFAACGRCLEAVRLEVDRELDLLYQPESQLADGAEVEIHTPDTELGFFAGVGVEVEEAAREQILLALPMQLVCAPECRGLCARCGANLNAGACACPPLADERWSALKSIRRS